MKENKSKFNLIFKSFNLKCPKCNEGCMFDNFYQIKVNSVCSKCKFIIAGEDSADGPAYIAMFLSSIILVVLGLFFESVFSPPIWVFITVGILFSFYLILNILRWSKSLLIQIQYDLNIDNYKNKDN